MSLQSQEKRVRAPGLRETRGKDTWMDLGKILLLPLDSSHKTSEDIIRSFFLKFFFLFLLS